MTDIYLIAKKIAAVSLLTLFPLVIYTESLSRLTPLGSLCLHRHWIQLATSSLKFLSSSLVTVTVPSSPLLWLKS